MPTVYLGLGSNIDPVKHLRFALGELEQRFGKLSKSSVYRSKAYGFDGDDFLNMVAGFETDLGPGEVHEQLEQIQAGAGRERRARGYSSRTLDIDLLLYDDLKIDEPPIRLPRPDVLRFTWVLGPLAEIAPRLTHPGTNQSYGELWEAFDRDSHPIVREDHVL